MSNIGNWVLESCSTIGTGALVLTGALSAKSTTWAKALGAVSIEVYYTIEDGNNRETGIGTFNGTIGITRDTILVTLVGGVYDDISPTAISLSGAANIGCAQNRSTFLSRLAKIGGTVKDYGEDSNAKGSISGAQTLDLADGNVITATITGATTFTFTTSHTNTSFLLELTNQDTNITWPTAVKWDGGEEPTWTVTGVDVIAFAKIGSVWYGSPVSIGAA